jgi:hypothetical protein
LRFAAWSRAALSDARGWRREGVLPVWQPEAAVVEEPRAWRPAEVAALPVWAAEAGAAAEPQAWLPEVEEVAAWRALPEAQRE